MTYFIDDPGLDHAFIVRGAADLPAADALMVQALGERGRDSTIYAVDADDPKWARRIGICRAAGTLRELIA